MGKYEGLERLMKLKNDGEITKTKRKWNNNRSRV